MKRTTFFVTVAAVFWFFIFSPWTARMINFWVGMCVATGVLSVLALRDRGPEDKDVFVFRWGHVGIGVLSAILLYGVFWAGRCFLMSVIPGVKENIFAVYVNRSQASLWLVGFLLFFWIGPAEEIFWRACVQRRLQKRMSLPKALFLSSAIYASVHIFSANPVLLLAALLCGFWWGGMFIVYRSVWPGIVSHAVWDVLVFIIFPLA